MKRIEKICIVICLATVLFALGSWAWQPAGWVYHNGSSYAYPSSDGNWRFLRQQDAQWRVNLSSGTWGTAHEAVGFMYYNWPYAYSSSQSSWYWHNPNDMQWCCNLSSGLWSLFGIPTAPDGMVYVEGGTFTMGDTWGDGIYIELPTHQVTLSPFYIKKTEVTNAEMARVMQWAYDNGRIYITDEYDYVKRVSTDSEQFIWLGSGYSQLSWDGSSFIIESGKENYPCNSVRWYGALAYCNFRSEMENLTPCYNLENWTCNWNANGYRLPTEAEWEFAAKGGVHGDYTKYSGSDNLDEVAWYRENSDAPGNSDLQRSYEGGVVVHRGTLPVATKAANELGVHDMSGNVYEWVWDAYSDYSDSKQTDPRGPDYTPGTADDLNRIHRGGGFNQYPEACTVARRGTSSQESGRFQLRIQTRIAILRIATSSCPV